MKEKLTLKVEDLSQELNVSENTIRRDFAKLEHEGFLVRLHGAASLAPQFIPQRLPYEKRIYLNLEAKQKIAVRAAELIQPGETVAVDSGSTCLELLHIIKYRADITILTPSLSILDLPSKTHEAQIILLGGLVEKKSNSLYGPTTDLILKTVPIDRAFIAATALDDHGNLYINNFNEIATKKLMIAMSTHSYALVDNSKLHKKGIAQFSTLKEFDSTISEN